MLLKVILFSQCSSEIFLIGTVNKTTFTISFDGSRRKIVGLYNWLHALYLQLDKLKIGNSV